MKRKNKKDSQIFRSRERSNEKNYAAGYEDDDLESQMGNGDDSSRNTSLRRRAGMHV